MQKEDLSHGTVSTVPFKRNTCTMRVFGSGIG